MTNKTEPTTTNPTIPDNIPDNITEAPANSDSNGNPNTNPSPVQDLYRHVNGHWLATHKIPADRPVDGTFHTLRDQSEKDVRAIIEAADTNADPRTPEGRIARLYSSFMDAEGIDKAGLKVLDEDLDGIRRASDMTEFAAALGALDRAGVGGVVGYYIEKDSGDSLGAEGLTQLYLVQTGLGLPDEAYYREDQHAQTREAYKAFVTDMFTLAGNGPDALPELAGNPAELANTLLRFETALAQGHWDNVTSRDADKTYNPTAIANLPTAFPFATWLEATGVPASHGTIVVNQPTYLDHVARLVPGADNGFDLDTWKLWAIWRVLTARAGLLPKAIVDRNWEFYSKTLSGATEQRARWKRGVGLVESQIGEEVGKKFVESHFPPEYKEKMLELVDYLIAAYRERIEKLDWMTDATKEKALVKLGKFTANIGYPDKWRSFDSLEFSADGADVLTNVRTATIFNHEYELAKLGKPAERDEWFCTPQTVNAFYNPVKNDITFPAAILRPPFFDAAADAAANFGAIGAVIGHEIGHGFDDQGSKFDGDGNLNSWWTDEDRAAFTELTDKLVAQFDGLVPTGLKQRGITEHTINGSFTLGENIGDLGGLGIAIVALRRYLADQGLDFESAPKAPVEGMDGEFTALQRVFLRWARIWQTAIRPQMAAQYASIDPHSPAEFRCNVISSNVAEFYQAFDVKPGDGMWLDEDQRVAIW